MNSYFKRHIKPALKKYNLNLEEIIKKAKDSHSSVSAFYPPPVNSKKEWEMAHIKHRISVYIIYGIRIFDEKNKVIQDWIGKK